MIEQTLSIIKPDAVAKNVIGDILSRFEKEGLKIVAMKMIYLTKEKAEDFYAVHKGKPFFEELVTYMSSGPITVQVLEGENAIEKNRKIMGATDPAKADANTIRKDYGTSIGSNAVHGSDAKETAKAEISYFFKEKKIFSR
jgi:nucleoside-diphosphate kinase